MNAIIAIIGVMLPTLIVGLSTVQLRFESESQNVED
jgi:hypothetical protein